MQTPLKRFTFHVNDKLIKSIVSVALSQNPLPNIHKRIVLVCHGLTGFFFYDFLVGRKRDDITLPSVCQ
jgi:hypothetical protein